MQYWGSCCCFSPLKGFIWAGSLQSHSSSNTTILEFLGCSVTCCGLLADRLMWKGTPEGSNRTTTGLFLKQLNSVHQLARSSGKEVALRFQGFFSKLAPIVSFCSVLMLELLAVEKSRLSKRTKFYWLIYYYFLLILLATMVPVEKDKVIISDK